MLARTDTVATIAQSWLAQFEAAVAAPDRPRLKTLFHTDSHLRDVLALTWHIKPVNGSDAILRELPTHAGHARPIGFQIDLHRSAPRKVTRAGTDAIESIFNFETWRAAAAASYGSRPMPMTATNSRPNFSEVPEMRVVLLNRPSELSLGAGEGSLGPTTAALANAFANATGRRLRELPMTPERVKRALA
jgi:hypothetical protein